MYVNQGPSSHPRTPTVVLINEVSNGGGFVTSSEISNTPTDSVFPLASSGFLLTGVYTTCITLTFGIPTPEPFTAAHVVTVRLAFFLLQTCGPGRLHPEHLEAHAPTSYAFAFTFTFAIGSVAPTATPTATSGPFSDPVPTSTSTADQQVTPSPEDPDDPSTTDPDPAPTSTPEDPDDPSSLDRIHTDEKRTQLKIARPRSRHPSLVVDRGHQHLQPCALLTG
ncbi:hypothetical protein B0H17DRAFT_1219258 [Mycena rosella]|uniref:Uncharacterized protein n=1 Tax=Mycena rosella TaxID=1033263 RepID=A0AAD7BJ49_MYCRO|nr:hypothetical protein B0H17DRAFT_1219258 [Mycena rosella]